MFRFLCKQLIRASTEIPHLRFLQTKSLKTNSISPEEKSLINVSYLINSYGLSLESANSASKKINIQSTENANSVLELFIQYGFANAQITKLITKWPRILQLNSDEILKPKIEYFKSLCFPTHLLIDLISKQPQLLGRSLKNAIVPCCNYIRTLVVTESNLVSVLRNNPRLLHYNVEKLMEPNISILRNHGVPKSHIAKWIQADPSTLMLNTERLEINIEKVTKLGFDPMTMNFVLAVQMIIRLSESIWEQKVEAFKSFGLSEEDILAAFKLNPLFMKPSEKKMRKLMAFFVTNLKWMPSVVSKYPRLMTCSLEKSIIPRSSVLQLLMSKGLVKEDLNVPAVLELSKKRFLAKYVIKYQDQIPEVVDAHQGKIQFGGFQNNSKSF